MPIGIRVTDLPAAAGTLDDDDEFLALEDGSLRRATRAQAGPKAAIVQVADTANQFTGTNVETVLAEIQDNVDALVISGGGMAAASTAEIIAGTDNTKAVTPLRLAEQIAPAAYGDPSGEADGTPTTLSDGTAVTIFGNCPIEVEAGAYSFNPIAGISAGYMQADLGDRVDRIGLTAVWEAGQSGTVALVVPLTAWANGSLTASGIHMVLTHAGSYTIGRWDGVSAVEIYRTGTLGTMVDGKPKTIDVTRDPADPSVAIVSLPNGVTFSVANAYIGTETGDYAVWEWFTTDGTSVTPGRITEVWADVATPQRRNVDAVRGQKLAASAGSAWAPAVRIIARNVALNQAAPNGTPADVDATNMYVTFYAPPSGIVLMEAEAWAEVNASSYYLMRFRGTTNTSGQRLVLGPYEGKVSYQQHLTGLTPGTAYTMYLQHWYSGGTGATFRSDINVGIHTVMRATPLVSSSFTNP